jgi:hypothetical protein
LIDYLFDLFPDIAHFYFFSIAADIVHPQIKTVEPGQILHMPSNKAMKSGIRLIEDTNPYAVGAISLIAHPELKAFFFSGLIYHLQIPWLLDIVSPSVVGLSKLMAWPGHTLAHFRQTSHIALTPISMGLSATSGIFVNTLLIRTRGPNRGAIKRPWRPSSPRPASTAMGMLSAVSFPLGIAS